MNVTPRRRTAFRVKVAKNTCFMRVSMMDFMPGKGEHETGIFCHFYGKSGSTSWRYVHVNVMSHIIINKFKMVEQRLCS